MLLDSDSPLLSGTGTTTPSTHSHASSECKRVNRKATHLAECVVYFFFCFYLFSLPCNIEMLLLLWLRTLKGWTSDYLPSPLLFCMSVLLCIALCLWGKNKSSKLIYGYLSLFIPAKHTIHYSLGLQLSVIFIYFTACENSCIISELETS